MGKYILISLIFILLPCVVFSQTPTENAPVTDGKEVRKEIKHEFERPGMLNRTNSEPFNNDLQVYSGLFAGVANIGGEINFTSPGTRLYGNIFFSGMINPERRIEDARRVYMAGFTVGREVLLSQSNRLNHPEEIPASALVIERSKAQFYSKIGGGFGFGGVGLIEENGFRLYTGIHTNILAGIQKNISGSGTFYAELGGRLMYFPVLNEMRFAGGPHITIGLQFSMGSGGY